MKDFLIVYEVKRRELENAYLLKSFLEKMGYSCDVCHFYESNYFSLFGRQNYKVIIVPQLYHTDYVARVFSRFGSANTIFNLQCEQVLSDDFEDANLHIPKGEARLAHHVCWGSRTSHKLAKSGIPESHLPILGTISVDFLRPGVISETSPTRPEISKQFDLDLNKKWILFTSSFTFADMPSDRKKMDERLLGLDLTERVELFSESRRDFLKWLTAYLEKSDDILIYRPHPDEYNLTMLYEVQKKFPNFRVISDFSVRVWTFLCDSIINWYSTSCVEAYFLKKPYFVLRPLPMPPEMELTLMKRVKKIDTIEEFLATDLFAIDERFHDKESMESFYEFDLKHPSVLLHAQLLDNIHKSNLRVEYKLPFSMRFKCDIKTYLAYFLHQFYTVFMKKSYKPSSSGNGLMFRTWFRAYYYNIANNNEIVEAAKKAVRICGILWK